MIRIVLIKASANIIELEVALAATSSATVMVVMVVVIRRLK